MQRVTAAADKAVAALQEAIREPSSARNRKAAEAIVALRKCFKHDGVTDWAGRSGEYRDLIERVYRKAGVPSDSESSMQANLRYHLGNALRKVAPPEDLEALGMTALGPSGRLKETRVARPRRVKAITAGDPGALAVVALDAIRALKTMSPGPGVERTLQKVIDEAGAVIGAINS